MLVIGIAGGSGSGKTTVVKELVRQLPDNSVSVISQDAYYFDNGDKTPEEKKQINFDHPDAIEWDLLIDHLDRLKKGETIPMPIYTYVTCARSQEVIYVHPTEVIIVEGIMALVNKDLRALGDLSVFINASRERRLVRRIERDQRERGRTYESIIEQYFASVQPMFEEIIAPSQYYADLIINNDGYTTKSIDVLVSVLNTMMLGKIN